MILPRIASASIVVAAMLFTAIPVNACDPQDICASDSLWYRATAVTLSVTDLMSGHRSQLKFVIRDDLNIAIEGESAKNGETIHGKVMLIGGRFLLTKGVDSKEGEAIDALDGCLLPYQLLATALSQAYPDGPDSIQGSKSVDIKEELRGIRIATQSAEGYYPPPWSLSGSTERVDARTIAFSLVFKVLDPKSRAESKFEGRWQKAVHLPVFDPHMSLEGWEEYNLGRYSTQQNNVKIIDYTTKAVAARFSTLGDAQKSLKK